MNDFETHPVGTAARLEKLGVVAAAAQALADTDRYDLPGWSHHWDNLDDSLEKLGANNGP